MTFAEKIVMVTGGASGIGKSCVSLLLSQGASVTVFDRAVPPVEEGMTALDRSRCRFISGDVASGTDVAAAVERIVKSSGRLDIGINCAGISSPPLRIVDQADDAMDEVLAINVRGIFLSMKYQLRAMAQQGFGAIVNAASVFSTRTMEGFGLYVASKHAVAGLTKSAAVEMARFGIRVNAVAPGATKTPFIGNLSAKQEQEAADTIPMLRLGVPVEVARAILWLASDEASYLTGSIMSVDGGVCANPISVLTGR